MSRLKTRLATGLVVTIGVISPVAMAGPVSAAPDQAAATSAGVWLVAATQDPTTLATGDIADTVIGLSATTGYYADVVRLTDALETQAAAYTAGNAPGAGKLALVAGVTGRDPSDFGGVDLLAVIAADITPDGIYGAYDDGTGTLVGDVFSQSITVLGLYRADAAIPQAAIDWLVGQQDPATGLFGFTDSFTDPANPAFIADPDYSGLALQALLAIEDVAPSADVAQAIDKVVAALPTLKKHGGYYESFSAINSTAIVGEGLSAAGENVDDLQTWLATQPLADGGFPNVIGGTTSDLKATAQGVLFLTDFSYLDATFVDQAPVVPPTTTAPAPVVADPVVADPAGGTTVAVPVAQGAPAGDTLAATGATPAALYPGLVALVLGTLLLTVERRTRRTYARKH